MNLQEKLNLTPHPEGGWYKEVYRSNDTLNTINGQRNVLTSIYFMLDFNNTSNFHVIQSDEIWYYHSGAPLTVHMIDPDGIYSVKKVGLDISNNEQPQVLVKKGTIFGSTVDVKGGETLVSCAVAPGFDFEDFYLFSREELLHKYPQHEKIIIRLTKN